MSSYLHRVSCLFQKHVIDLAENIPPFQFLSVGPAPWVENGPESSVYVMSDLAWRKINLQLGFSSSEDPA